ncbi:MAG: DUF309 domain-containing protein [Desulfurococcales archaeon]|nr:DUF309 domain-containing protein [Desulfurococcales archaeon]
MERITLQAPNQGSLKPRDAARIKEKIRTLGGVKSVNIRITPSHIEIDMVASRDTVEKIEGLLGPLHPPPAGDPWSLARKQMFWQAHEILEEEWRRTRDPRIEAAIKAMAALAKAQEGNLEAALRIASRIPPDTGIDRRCVEEMATRAYQGHEADILECIGGHP